jgi:hypothetical protein
VTGRDETCPLCSADLTKGPVCCLPPVVAEPNPFPDDYPAWTRYSSGNPLGWRRIYRGLLLYAFDRGEGRVACWFGPDNMTSPAASLAEAQAAAERWAEAQTGMEPKVHDCLDLQCKEAHGGYELGGEA